jgi:zinc and cadmium transporter
MRPRAIGIIVAEPWRPLVDHGWLEVIEEARGMSTLAYILVFSTLGSVISLVGGVLLLSRREFAQEFSHLLAPFAAGTLLATAFLDLLPEAVESASGKKPYVFALGGLLVFFLLERFVRWFHHHHEHDDQEYDPATVPLVVFGDSLHNLIDGIVIGGTFLVGIPMGMVTTLAIAAHEIPQEIGDFGLLLNRGLSRGRVLAYNLLSALMTVVGALLAWSFGQRVTDLLPVFLGFTAGFFIYIAASDIIPEIHRNHEKRFALVETLLLLLGVAVVALGVSLLH